jgi:hypothetical protein
MCGFEGVVAADQYLDSGALNCCVPVKATGRRNLRRQAPCVGSEMLGMRDSPQMVELGGNA